MAEAVNDMQIFPGLTLGELDELETLFCDAQVWGYTLDEAQIALRAKLRVFYEKLARYADLYLPVPELRDRVRPGRLLQRRRAVPR